MMPLRTGVPDCPDLSDLAVRDLTLDSREVGRNDVFVALKGAAFDGHDYIDAAVKAGAVAVIAEHPVAGVSVPVVVMSDLRTRLGDLAHDFYQAPSEQLQLIGITGTNGKTSTCQYIAQSLDYLGKRCGIIGTNGQGLWGALQETLNTTPDVVRLHRELARQRDQGGRFCAMEVSSHGLDQGRVAGVRYKTAVFTNLSRDHLDYHGTMEAYGNAKWTLLQWPGLVNAIVNLDDDWVQQHLGSIRAERVITFGHSSQADVRVVSHQCHPGGIDAVVATPWGKPN